jgi:hypothetical protein
MDGVGCDEQFFGNLRVGPACAEKSQDFYLSIGEVCWMSGGYFGYAFSKS